MKDKFGFIDITKKQPSASPFNQPMQFGPKPKKLPKPIEEATRPFKEKALKKSREQIRSAKVQKPSDVRDVETIQQQLIDAGYLPATFVDLKTGAEISSADGAYGPRTALAYAAYKADQEDAKKLGYDAKPRAQETFSKIDRLSGRTPEQKDLSVSPIPAPEPKSTELGYQAALTTDQQEAQAAPKPILQEVDAPAFGGIDTAISKLPEIAAKSLTLTSRSAMIMGLLSPEAQAALSLLPGMRAMKLLADLDKAAEGSSFGELKKVVNATEDVLLTAGSMNPATLPIAGPLSLAKTAIALGVAASQLPPGMDVIESGKAIGGGLIEGLNPTGEGKTPADRFVAIANIGMMLAGTKFGAGAVKGLLDKFKSDPEGLVSTLARDPDIRVAMQDAMSAETVPQSPNVVGGSPEFMKAVQQKFQFDDEVTPTRQAVPDVQQAQQEAPQPQSVAVPEGSQVAPEQVRLDTGRDSDVRPAGRVEGLGERIDEVSTEVQQLSEPESAVKVAGSKPEPEAVAPVVKENLTTEPVKPVAESSSIPQAEPLSNVPETPEPKKYSVSNAATDEARIARGEQPITERPRIQRENIEEIKKSYDRDAELEKVRIDRERVQRGEQPVSQSEADVELSTMLVADLSEEIRKIDATIKAGKDVPESTAQRLEELTRQLEDVEIANLDRGTEAGRALAARARAIYNDYSPAGLYRQVIRAERKLDPTAKAKADATAAEITRLNEELAAKTEELRLAQMKETVKRSTPSGRGQKADFQARRSEAANRIKEKFNKLAASNVQSDPFLLQTSAKTAEFLTDIAPDVIDIARSYYDQGVLEIKDIVKKTTEFLKSNGADVEEGDVITILDPAFARKPRVQGPPAPSFAKTRSQLGKLRATPEAKLSKRLSQYQDKLKQRQYVPKTKKEIELEGEIGKLQIDVEVAKLEWQEFMANKRADIETQKLSKSARFLREFMNLPRSLVASTDISAPGNQGLFAFLAHPVQATKALIPMLKSIPRKGGGKGGYLQEIAKVKTNPLYGKAVSSGLAIVKNTDFALDPGGDLFLSKLVGKELNIGGVDVNPVNASNRAYSAYLNSLRMDMFSNMYKYISQNGKRPVNMAELREISDWVNVSTGSPYGKAGEAARSFQKKFPVMFALPYLVSRWQLSLGGNIVKSIRNGNVSPKVAAYIAKDYMKAVVAIPVTLQTISMMTGWKLELNPDDPKKFLTLTTPSGTTSDPFKSLLEPLRIAIGSYKKIEEPGEFKNGYVENAYKDAAQWAQYKLAPSPKAVIAIMDGLRGVKSFDKNTDPRTTEGWQNILSGMLPITVQQYDELAKSKIPDNEKAIFAAGIPVGSSFSLPRKPKPEKKKKSIFDIPPPKPKTVVEDLQRLFAPK